MNFTEMFRRKRMFLGAFGILLAIIGLSSTPPAASFQPLFPQRVIHDSPTAARNSNRLSSALFVSSASSTSSSKTGNDGEGSQQRVVYQKVIKAPLDPKNPSSGNPLFLGCLVEYLQDYFTLPEKLPMVYESRPPKDKSIASWDSPMSPSPVATRLDLEVIALYTDNNDDDNNIDSSPDQQVAPSMAMVVVRKAKNLGGGGSSNNQQKVGLPSPMMQNLFDDSEQRIIKALDRGLDDFMAGKIPLDSLANAQQEYQEQQKRKKAHQAAQDAMIEEMLEDAEVDHPSVSENTINNEEKEDSVLNDRTNNVQKVLDADFSKEEEKDPPQSAESKSSNHKKSKSPVKAAPSLDAPQDFAIQAAKRAAAKLKKKNPDRTAKPLDDSVGNDKVTLDFAVAAAQKISKTMKKQGTTSSTTSTSSAPRDASKATQTQKPSLEASPIQASSSVGDTEMSPYDFQASPPDDGRAFRKTFSSPKEFAAKRKQQKQNEASRDETTSTGETKVKTQKATVRSSAAAEASIQQPPADTGQAGPKRKLNLKVVDDEEDAINPESTLKASGDNAKKVGDEDVFPPGDTLKEKTATGFGKARDDKRSSKAKQMQSKKIPTEQEIMKTTQQVMSEIAEQGVDISAEEMLQDVLKFGEKREQENQVGSGFVSGAFETAKELLREQKKMRDRSVATQTQAQTTTKNTKEPQVKTREISSEEEELRKMFEAGERLADGRISLSTRETKVASGTMTEEDEKLVDELVAADTSVSSHARILDDELAELEVQIRQTPGEELDGPPKNPLFDIFSGPEVYNPNADPESAVNWPGAMPGSKSSAVESKLHKDLGEAITQAKFASEVLQKIEEREFGEGDDKKAYFVGENEISEQQVQNLQNVVNEAVEIGIIQNPLALMQERSRLQMVLDELWTQPEDRMREILMEYKELLLSDNFVDLIKELLQAMAQRDLDALRRRKDDNDIDVDLEQNHAREREILGQLVESAQLLIKEARAMGAELEAQQLEVIRSICKVAMDPSHTTEEETAAALTDAVRDMRPLFDEMFVAYLKYAVAEEEGRLARAGVLDDPDHNQWLFVLKIVQQGVYAELAKGINRYIEHIWYVLRMESAKERRMLLEKLIDVLPTLDVRPFVRVVDNIVSSLGDVAKGEIAAEEAYELGKMSNKLLQLHRDMKELLPPDRIEQMSRDADEWAAKQRERMMEQRRLTKQRIAAARETEEYDGEIETMGRRGEMERFD